MTEIPVYSQSPPEFKDEDLVCYCFDHTRADIEKDYIEHNGFSTIFKKIADEKMAQKCDCARKNPRGR